MGRSLSTSKLEPRLAIAAAELVKALQRIEEPQGDRARRTARAAVLGALGKLRKKLDDYPVARRKGLRRKKRSREARWNELRAQGFVAVDARHILGRIAEAGIKTKSLEGNPGMHRIVYAPEWAVMIAAAKPTKLKLAKRSIRERRALMTEIWLERGNS